MYTCTYSAQLSDCTHTLSHRLQNYLSVVVRTITGSPWLPNSEQLHLYQCSLLPKFQTRRGSFCHDNTRPVDLRFLGNPHLQGHTDNSKTELVIQYRM